MMCIYTHIYTYIHTERSQLQYKLHISLEAKGHWTCAHDLKKVSEGKCWWVNITLITPLYIILKFRKSSCGNCRCWVTWSDLEAWTTFCLHDSGELNFCLLSTYTFFSLISLADSVFREEIQAAYTMDIF